MSLLEQYPKTFRNNTRELRATLATVPDMAERPLADIAMMLSGIADKACDIEDIFQKMMRGPSAEELADLLAAFELTLEQIRGSSDFVDGKLYEMSDRLRGETPAETANAEGESE